MRLLVLLGICTSAFAQTPVINPQGVVNSASSQAQQGIAPGGLISIFGSELASSVAQSDTLPLSSTISEVSVTINDIAAPLAMVSPNQINAQVPWELFQDQGGTGTASVVVRRSGVASQASTVQVNRFSPALFTLPFGFGQAIAVNADGTLAAPAGSVPGTTSSPAKRGRLLILFATGLGPVDPAIPNGAPALEVPRVTTTPPVVMFGDKAASIQFSGLTPLFPGVYQINLTVPDDAPTGLLIPVTIQMGDVKSTQRATVAVE